MQVDKFLVTSFLSVFFFFRKISKNVTLLKKSQEIPIPILRLWQSTFQNDQIKIYLALRSALFLANQNIIRHLKLFEHFPFFMLSLSVFLVHQTINNCIK